MPTVTTGLRFYTLLGVVCCFASSCLAIRHTHQADMLGHQLLNSNRKLKPAAAKEPSEVERRSTFSDEEQHAYNLQKELEYITPSPERVDLSRTSVEHVRARKSKADAGVRKASVTSGEIASILTSTESLVDTSITIQPDSSTAYSVLCTTSGLTSLPESTTGATKISPFNDDDYELVSFSSGTTFPFFGVAYNHMYVGSNGYITFNSGDTTWTTTITSHFNRPRISCLYTDIHPGQGGAVYYKLSSTKAVVSWVGIPYYPNFGSVTMQAELYFSTGVIKFHYLTLTHHPDNSYYTNNYMVVGVSSGNGQPSGFTDTGTNLLTGASTCSGAVSSGTGYLFLASSSPTGTTSPTGATSSAGSCACTRNSRESGNCPTSPAYALCGGSGLVCGARVHSTAIGRYGTVARNNDQGQDAVSPNVLVCFDGYSGHHGNGFGCDDDDGTCSRVLSERCAYSSSWWVLCNTLTLVSPAPPTNGSVPTTPSPTTSPTGTSPTAPARYEDQGHDGSFNPCRADGTDYCCDWSCTHCGPQGYCETQSPFLTHSGVCNSGYVGGICGNYFQLRDVSTTRAPTGAPTPCPAAVPWEEHAPVLQAIEKLKHQLVETKLLVRRCERELQRTPGARPPTDAPSATTPPVQADTAAAPTKSSQPSGSKSTSARINRTT